jgi:hypothetical protein
MDVNVKAGRGWSEGSGGSKHDHLAVSASGWTLCKLFSQGTSREVAAIDCDIPPMTSRLEIDCSETWVARLENSQQSIPDSIRKGRLV